MKSQTKRARAAPEIDLSSSRRSPGRLIHVAHLRLRAGLIGSLEEAGHSLSAEGWAVLSLLWEQDGLTQIELSERVGKDRHHTSRLVDALERQGLVARVSTDPDRRLKRVALTAHGRAVRARLTRVVGEYLERVFEGVSQSDYDAFMRCLDHIVGRLPARDGMEGGE